MSGADKPGLLFLCHRIPFPPNKGDKIRSFHLLRFLCEHYRVYLGAFVDDEEDWQYRSELETICEQVCLVHLSPRAAKLKSLTGMLFGQALSIPYYRNRQLREWVITSEAKYNITRAVVFSSTMAQYVVDTPIEPERKVLDLVDIDSDKWRQYAENKPWPLNWLYRREANCLLAYEKHMASAFDYSFFVSEPEAKHFLLTHPEGKNRVGYYNNGVDCDYFDPAREYYNPYSAGEKVLVFTGAMDYWPNVDAVVWFAKQVFPQLLAVDPLLRFYVVGRNPTRLVVELSQLEGVQVTGSVVDVRPYILHARVAVAPMRMARGVQNKVLEAMAMEKVVLVSAMGLEGIQAEKQLEIMVVETAEQYQQALLSLDDEHHREIGKAARRRVQADFSWNNSLPLVREKLEMMQDA